MPTISVRKLAILALLNGPDGQGTPKAPIVGTTRLQKLLFVTERSLPRISGDRAVRFDFQFEPYRYGPADLHLYQDLEFLVALGHVVKSEPDEAGDTPLGPEESTERSLGFAYLMGDEDEAELFAEAESEPETWSISQSGERVLSAILASVDGKAKTTCERVVEAATEVKKKYGTWPLPRLLRFVYSEYPEMTTSSEIRERVLGSD